MPDPSTSPDATVLASLPLLAVIGGTLRLTGLPEAAVALLQQLANLGLSAAMVAALAAVRRRAVGPAGTAGLTLAASVLGWWIVRHPGTGFEAALARGDHLLFAGTAGAALRTAPLQTRKRVLTIVSTGALGLLAGPAPLAIVLGGMAIAVAAARRMRAARIEAIVAVQALALLGTFALCCRAWALRPAVGLGAQGLFAVLLLRHVSWLVDVHRGAGGSLVDYWCYQLFYPCCFGSIERYGDFWTRNPEAGAIEDDAAMFRTFMRGAVYFWLSLHLHTPLTTMLAAPTWAALVAYYAVVFVHGALVGMGLWSMLQAIALCWGMRIHPNFAGVLAARSPSQFWYAWRGTMTRWLIEYVYIPLGGNRAWQTRNVFAVFAVSALWHWMGVPFVQNRLRLTDFAPIGAWALVNAIVLAAAGLWRRRHWRLWPEGTPAPLRTGAARLGTWAFGGVTVAFLAFQGPIVARFPEFLQRLIGGH